MENEYLSIKDFAAAAGVSQQAIYKQLNNKLKTYLKIVDNRKMLNKSALSLFKQRDNSTDIQKQLINMLQSELNEKNQQLNEKDKQIAELQKLLSQSQQLNAMDKQKILELEDHLEVARKAQDQTVEHPPQKKWWQWFK